MLSFKMANHYKPNVYVGDCAGHWWCIAIYWTKFLFKKSMLSSKWPTIILVSKPNVYLGYRSGHWRHFFRSSCYPPNLLCHRRLHLAVGSTELLAHLWQLDLLRKGHQHHALRWRCTHGWSCWYKTLCEPEGEKWSRINLTCFSKVQSNGLQTERHRGPIKIIFFLFFLYFFKWAIPGLFFLYFRLFNTQLTVNKCSIYK